jgi:hypothetical protein
LIRDTDEKNTTQWVALQDSKTLYSSTIENPTTEKLKQVFNFSGSQVIAITKMQIFLSFAVTEILQMNTRKDPEFIIRQLKFIGGSL